jgi:hypothetical protein
VSERPTLLDALVDLAVYAPVGLALTAAEELPELIAKGRSRIEPQLGTARLVGQLVVSEGRRRAIKFSRFGGAGDSRPAGQARTGGTEGQPAADRSTSGGEPEEPPARSVPATRSARPSTDAAAADVPEVESLAIPGYDSLSASQVVQRLAGLSPSELSAVGRYEAANRGRTTILARVTQLQGD